MAKLIYLSPSNHGKGNNPCLKSGCYEDKHTRPMAEAAAKYLRANGFRAIVAKESQSMAERCAESDRLGADIHMPIHTNAAAKKINQIPDVYVHQKNRRILEDVQCNCTTA